LPAARSREVVIAAAGFALVIALATVGALLSPPGDEGFPSGSSFSHRRDGSAAAYLTLERLGYRIRRSFDAVDSLTMDPAADVLVLADPLEGPSNADRRALQSLATAGATVLVTGCGGLAFLSDITASREPSVEQTYPARFPSPLSARVPQVTMRADCEWPPSLDRYAALYGDGPASAVRFLRSGRGVIVWWAASTPIANASIAAPGNLELLLDLTGARGRTILWDEFYHGQRRSLYSYARQTPLPWAAAQVLVVMLVAAAMYARRRAPILERAVESRASPLEFVDTIAGLYAQAGTAADAVAIARARLRRLLSAATGLAPDADDERLVAAAATRRRIDANAVRAALAASAGPFVGDFTADDALPLVRRLQSAAAALERTGG